jgi:hypothetical protein
LKPFLSWLLLAAAASTSIACGSSPSAPTATRRAQLTDPAGDTLAVGTTFAPRTSISPDLRSATFEIAGGVLIITVRFQPESYQPEYARVTVTLDTDQSVATGSTHDPGMDYSIRIEPEPASSSIVKTHRTTSTDVVEFANRIRPTLIPDGVEMRIPMALLENDDGLMHVRLTSHVQLYHFAAGLWTGNLDVMPDSGSSSIDLR